MARCQQCGVDGLGGITHQCPPAAFSSPPMPKRPHRCPICNGTGAVPAGFYSSSGFVTSTAPEGCRACDGSGVIIA